MTISVVDIEREIERMYVIGLRAVFEIDNIFVYNDDDTVTKVMITPDYPEKNNTLMIPHLIVANTSFDFNMNTSYYNNYYEDVFDNTGVCIGAKHVNLIPYAVNIECLGEFYLSKDLANKVVDYITFTTKEVFETMRLNVQRVGKGLTNPQQQWGEHIFGTPVSIQGYLEWVGVKTTDTIALQILQRIKQNLEIKI